MTTQILTSTKRAGRPRIYATTADKKRAHAESSIKTYYRNKGTTPEAARMLKAKRKSETAKAKAEARALKERLRQLKVLYTKARTLNVDQLDAIINSMSSAIDAITTQEPEINKSRPNPNNNG